MAKKRLELERGSLMILVVMGIIPLVIAALEKFDVISLSSQLSSILVILSSGFILNEQVRKHKRRLFKQTSSSILMFLVGLALLGSILSLLGFVVPSQLSAIEGLLLVVIIITTLIELRN